MGPPERHSHQNRAVAIAPADGGGRLLVRYQSEVGGGVGVAEGCQGGCAGHETRDGGLRNVAQASAPHVLVQAVLHDASVHVHAAAGLPVGDLGRKRHVQAVEVGHVADDPLGNDQFVRRLLHVGDHELDLVLLIDLVTQREITHLGVAILDVAARPGYGDHAVGAEPLELGERRRLMITALVLSQEQVVLVADDVELKLPHGLEGHSGHLLERPAGLLEDMFRRYFCRPPVLVVEGAEEAEGRYLAEGVHEGGPEARDHVKVAGARIKELGEDVGAVHPLAKGEDLLQIVAVGENEVKCLEPPVAGRVAEVYHLYSLGLYEADDVRLGELPGRLFQE